MDVAFHAADEEWRAIELFGDAAEIRMERVARGCVAQERPAVFGGENQMNLNGGKGLWHDGRMVNRGVVCERESATERDCVRRTSRSSFDNGSGVEFSDA